MSVALRISLGAPIAVVVLVVFLVALLLEWLGDIARTCPHSENMK